MNMTVTQARIKQLGTENSCARDTARVSRTKVSVIRGRQIAAGREKK